MKLKMKLKQKLIKETEGRATFSNFGGLPNVSFSLGTVQGRIQPEVDGEGQFGKGAPKKKMKSERAEGARKFFGLRSMKFSGFSSE